MDISQVDSDSGSAPQSSLPQASIVVRPSDEAGQSVDGMLPMAPLVPSGIPPTAVLAAPPLTQGLTPTAQPAPTLTPMPSASDIAMPPQSTSTSAPLQTAAPRSVDAVHTAPPVPGGFSPKPIAIDKVFQTPEEAKAQMVSQVPPVAEPTPIADTPVAAKKSSKPSLPILIGLIVGGVILLAGVAFITFSMLSKKSASSTTPTNTMLQPVVIASSDVTTFVTNAISGSTNALNMPGPSYQVAKAAYSVVVPAEAAIAFPAADTAAAATTYSKIVSALSANGLKERAVIAGTAKSPTEGVFDATGTHCQVMPGVKTLTLTCANTKTYEDTTTKLAPVYTAFTTARPVDKTKQPQTLAITRWAASKTQGYTIATISITDVKVGSVPVDHLFYQMPDESWHYVGEALSTTGCGNFNTPDLKKAFLGEPCMNGTAKATVVLQ